MVLRLLEFGDAEVFVGWAAVASRQCNFAGLQPSEIQVEAPDAGERSIRVLRRLGFDEVGRGEDTVFFGRPSRFRSSQSPGSAGLMRNEGDLASALYRAPRIRGRTTFLLHFARDEAVASTAAVLRLARHVLIEHWVG